MTEQLRDKVVRAAESFIILDNEICKAGMNIDFVINKLRAAKDGVESEMANIHELSKDFHKYERACGELEKLIDSMSKLQDQINNMANGGNVMETVNKIKPTYA